MTNKYLFMSAIATLALASCANDDYLGSNTEEAAGGKAIQFTGGTKAVTRSTSSDVDKLNGQFVIYGIKTVGSANYDVFKNYYVWDAEANSTTSNTRGWEYVADAGTTNLGTGKITIGTNTCYTQAEIDDAKAIVEDPAYVAGSNPDAEAVATKTTSDIKEAGKDNQTIKYWDYSADNYHFVAGSPIDAFTYKFDDDGNITSAEYDASRAVLIADPVIVEKANYGEPVTFVFKSPATLVRVGVYETIPGYSISEIKFYTQDGSASSSQVTLQSATEGYFNPSITGTGVVKYDWTNLKYTLESKSATPGTGASQNWYGNEFTDGVKAVTSSDDDLFGTGGGSNGYFTVTPTTKTAAPIIIKCDYTLKSDDGRTDETIKVSGATAAVPAAYSLWKQNTQYTYLFKISDNTNGYTGGYNKKEDPENPGTYIDDPTDPIGPEGLFPITFDAAVVDASNDYEGTITTVATPSITTYQDGSVIAKGVKYVTGKDITVKATDATGAVLTGAINVYSLGTTAKTEAELQLAAPTGANLASDGVFTPSAAGYYAVQYTVSAAVNYTQAEIDAAKAITEDAAYVAGSDPDAEALAGKTTDDVKTPAVYAYKVVYVVAAE